MTNAKFVDFPEKMFPLCILAFAEDGSILFAHIIQGATALTLPSLEARGGIRVERLIFVFADGTVTESSD